MPQKAWSNKAKHASAQSVEDMPAPRRGGQRSHRGQGGRTRDQLYEEAQRKGIRGRSTMTKGELERAVDRK